MKSIGIVGTGIAGLQLGLFLQQNGVEAVIYSDRTPEQIRAGRIPNFVIRFPETIDRERELGVNHWDYDDFGVCELHMHIGVGPAPIVWKGSPKRPMSGVDMRVYQARLLEDFARRGGEIDFGEMTAEDVAEVSARHDLVVVASGRGSLTGMFPRDAARSPYDRPQRRLTGAFFRGLRISDPVGITFAVASGHGEIFQAPYTTFGGRRVSNILFEGIPGGDFDRLMDIRYDVDPAGFEAAALDLVRRHAPPIYERIDPEEFGVLRPLDVLQGAVTPTVRRGYVALGGGKFALALGDVHVVNDPVLGQGANAASRCARILGETLLEERPIDEHFCRETEWKLWQSARAATEWTNATLQPAPPHAVELFAAAAGNRALADELADNFNRPERNWEIFSDPARAAGFVRKHTRMPVAV